jgi:hypothetical protein
MSIVPVTGFNDVSRGGLLIGSFGSKVHHQNYIDRHNKLAASSLIRTAKNVKIYQVSLAESAVYLPPRLNCLLAQQAECEHLGKQCLDLASTLHDHSPGLEGTSAQQVVDEVELCGHRCCCRLRLRLLTNCP